MKAKRVVVKRMVDDIAILSNDKFMWNGRRFDSFNEAVTARAVYVADGYYADGYGEVYTYC